MSTTLFVGHIAYETTEWNLQALFEEAGTVVSCDVARDKFSGRPMGFAYVEMSSPAEARKAIRRLNGSELHGRQLNIREASV